MVRILIELVAAPQQPALEPLRPTGPRLDTLGLWTACPNVPAKEKDEVLATVSGLKKDLVEKP